MCRDRPSYRDIDYDGSDRPGDYRMYGELSRVGDYEGGYGADIIDSRRYDRGPSYRSAWGRTLRTSNAEDDGHRNDADDEDDDDKGDRD